MVGNLGSLVINYAIDTKASFDPMKDVVPIAGTAEYATAMVVNNKMPVNSVKEFIAYAKERPGKLTFGSTGVGAMDYLAGELFMQKTGIKMVHVPYRGGPLALNDLIAGQIDSHHRGLSGGERAGPLRHDQGPRGHAARPPADRCRTCRPSRRPACRASS